MELLAEDFRRDLKNAKNIKLRYEFTQSLLLSAEQAKGEWERLKRLKTTLNGQRKPIIERGTLGKKGSRYKVVKIHENSGEKNIQITGSMAMNSTTTLTLAQATAIIINIWKEEMDPTLMC